MRRFFFAVKNPSCINDSFNVQLPLSQVARETETSVSETETSVSETETAVSETETSVTEYSRFARRIPG